MAGKPKVLMNFHMPPLAAAIGRDYQVETRPDQQSLTDYLSGHGAGFDVVVSAGSMPISAADLDFLTTVKAVVLFSAGYEGVDLAACKARNIAVTTCSGANAGDVADMAFGLLLSAARNIAFGDRFIRSGGWVGSGRGSGLRDGLYGAKLGILGLGAIGLCIARRASGFEMPIFYHNRKPRAGVDAAYTYVGSAVELAQVCDHLMIACPLTPETHQLVDQQVLEALGPNGILVNIARGGVVDEPALIRALESNVILGAGLDVFANEPHVPEALRVLDNVVMTPHTSGFTRRVFRQMGDLVQENIRRVIAGEDLINRVA